MPGPPRTVSLGGVSEMVRSWTSGERAAAAAAGGAFSDTLTNQGGAPGLQPGGAGQGGTAGRSLLG